MTTTHLYALIQGWKDTFRWNPPSDAQLGRAIGVTRSAVYQWKVGENKPKPPVMRALHVATGIPYRELLDAMLTDQGYLPFNQQEKEVTGGEQETPAPIARRAAATRRSKRVESGRPGGPGRTPRRG